MVPRPTACTAALALAALVALLPGAALAQPPTRNLTFKAQKNDYAPAPGGQNYSACWSYIHSDGREYAVIGVNGPPGGTAIYNVTIPESSYLVGFIPGPTSIWREMKSYRDWIYVVSEGSGTGYGLQIVRMTNPESPVLAATYTTNFTRSHTVSVDTTRGILICNGTTGPSGGAGMRILALNNSGIGATPETPVEIAWWPGGSIPISNNDYVHDSVPIGNRLYASSIYPGIQRVLDFTNPAAPSQLNSWTYPGGFTHNSWPDATGNWLYVTDEVKGERLKIFDISNLGAPLLANAITSNPQSIVHNAHVKGAELYLSNYTEGIRVLDLSDPCHPAEFAWADSYAGPSGGYSGVWAVSPFYPSGTVIASDRNSGLYVYRIAHDYGIVRVKVMDEGTGLPAPGVTVYLTTQGDSLATPADGIVQFAPSPGTHTVLAHSFGWGDATATRTVSAGSRDTVILTIAPRPVVNFTGVVRTSAGGAPLDQGEVSLAYTSLHNHTGPSGTYALLVPDDTYLLEVRRAGYIPLERVRRIGPGFPGQDYSLTPAPIWLDLESGTGWTVGAAGDNATQGIWTRVAPLGTGPRPPSYAARPARPGGAGARRADGAASGALPREESTLASGRSGPLGAQHEGGDVIADPNMAPYTDHTPGTGTLCFVTGQGTDSTNVYNGDVDGGKTSLTTPAFDMTGVADPTIGYWRWFCSYFPTGIATGHNGPDDSDYLAVLISNDNGANWTVVDTTRGIENHWEEQAVHVADYVTPTAQVKLRFVADNGGTDTACEAAIDDITAYDDVIAAIDVPPPVGRNPLAFRAPWPNPASGAVRLVLDVPVAAEVAVDVVDLAGRRIAVLRRGVAEAGPLTLAWDGRDASGREAPAGLYFARATVGAERALARFVRVR